MSEALGRRGTTIADRVAMFELLSATWIAQPCYTLAKLGVPDLLADGPKSVAELTGSDRRALGRVLRALSPVGVAAP